MYIEKQGLRKLKLIYESSAYKMINPILKDIASGKCGDTEIK